MVITFHRPNIQVPCNCEGGPCGWVHHDYAGPARFYIDDVEVTKDEAKAARDAYRRDRGLPGATGK